jgi:hypothetical protein
MTQIFMIKYEKRTTDVAVINDYSDKNVRRV